MIRVIIEELNNNRYLITGYERNIPTWKSAANNKQELFEQLNTLLVWSPRNEQANRERMVEADTAQSEQKQD